MNVLEVVTASGPEHWTGRSVLWLIDGQDLRDLVAEAERGQGAKRPGNYWGARRDKWCDPIQMALGEHADPLAMDEADGDQRPYVWLGTCSCGEEGCSSIVADLLLGEAVVRWDDVRVVTAADKPPTRPLGLSFVFDRTQYNAALSSYGARAFDPRPARY